MKRIISGLFLGAAAGIVDILPMIAQKLTWDANLSAFSMWVVVGFFLATSKLRLPGPVLGLLTSFLCLFPVSFIIGWKQPLSLVPIAIMTAILGCLLGLTFSKIAAKKPLPTSGTNSPL